MGDEEKSNDQECEAAVRRASRWQRRQKIIVATVLPTLVAVVEIADKVWQWTHDG